MIIGTAGHIDHGKTALVRALTGVDTDRLPEEKRRGITIALGFAPLVLPEVGMVGVVDVPGHEAFVRTMLAGASGIDCALVVVAADEGVKPQTREHLEVLRLLGVTRGVIAVTKADLADDELRTLVAMEVTEALATSSLAAAPLLPVSAKTGEGIEALRHALAALLRDVPARDVEEPWRLPVDRVFSVAGAGTVVTGTAWSGELAVGAAVRLLPGDRAARVRSIEMHGEAAARAVPGARVALALVGVERTEIHPGDSIVRADQLWDTTRVLRADVTLLAEAPRLGARSRVRFHLGTAECGARIVVRVGGLAPGATVPARVVLDAPVVVRAGDHFVLRGGTPHTTIGGGVVSDPLPLTRRAKPWDAIGASASTRLLAILAEAGALGVDVAQLPQRLGLALPTLEKLLKATKGVVRIGTRLVEAGVLDALRSRLLALVEQMHAAQPLAPGLDRQTARAALSANDALADEVIRRAERAGVIEVVGSAIRRPGFDPSASTGASDAKTALLDVLRAAGAEPPSVAELQAAHGKEVPALLKLLEREGAVVPVALDRWFSTAAVSELLSRLKTGTVPERRYAPSALREMLGVSRKYLIPFLEWCDRRGISRRSDDGRSFPAIPENP